MARRKLSKEQHRELWTDAYRIAWVGAANPTAVASAIRKHSSVLVGLYGTRGAEKHPAMIAMVGHLAYLFGMGIGPDFPILDKVSEHAKQLGIFV